MEPVKKKVPAFGQDFAQRGTEKGTREVGANQPKKILPHLPCAVKRRI